LVELLADEIEPPADRRHRLVERHRRSNSAPLDLVIANAGISAARGRPRAQSGGAPCRQS
jgi:hypothetical protein